MGGENNATKNRVKKLVKKYQEILALEVEQASGRPLNQEQLSKLARKEAVAEELVSLGGRLPQLPPPPPPPPGLADAAAAAAAFGVTMRPAAVVPQPDITPEEVTAAMDSLSMEGQRVPGGRGQAQQGGGPRRPPSGALKVQHQLRERHPEFSYFFTLPPPMPDLGVQLQDAMAAIFLEMMLPRAEAGEPRAVKMLFETLRPCAAQHGLPVHQLRLQLCNEYGIDPATEQAVEGTPEALAAWLEAITPAAELARDVRGFEPLVERMLDAQGIFPAGGRRGGQQGRGRRR